MIRTQFSLNQLICCKSPIQSKQKALGSYLVVVKKADSYNNSTTVNYIIQVLSLPRT